MERKVEMELKAEKKEMDRLTKPKKKGVRNQNQEWEVEAIRGTERMFIIYHLCSIK